MELLRGRCTSAGARGDPEGSLREVLRSRPGLFSREIAADLLDPHRAIARLRQMWCEDMRSVAANADVVALVLSAHFGDPRGAGMHLLADMLNDGFEFHDSDEDFMIRCLVELSDLHVDQQRSAVDLLATMCCRSRLCAKLVVQLARRAEPCQAALFSALGREIERRGGAELGPEHVRALIEGQGAVERPVPQTPFSRAARRLMHPNWARRVVDFLGNHPSVSFVTLLSVAVVVGAVV